MDGNSEPILVRGEGAGTRKHFEPARQEIALRGDGSAKGIRCPSAGACRLVGDRCPCRSSQAPNRRRTCLAAPAARYPGGGVGVVDRSVAPDTAAEELTACPMGAG